MTREDIDRIASEYFNDKESEHEMDEVFDLAKKAFEKQTQELSGDAVSRQAIDEIKELMTDINGDTVYAVRMSDLRQLPPFNPQKPKTGHWEWVQYDYNPKIGNWHCSECRCIVVECVGKKEKGGIPLYKYCPQCGARMFEPQESEDE